MSRASNAIVLARAAHTPATDILRKKRLQLFGKILRVDVQHPLKRACFIPGTFVPVAEQYVRRVGRPSKERVREVIQETIALFGNTASASASAQNQFSWTWHGRRETRFLNAQADSLSNIVGVV